MAENSAQEVWASVPNYPEYEISNFGKFRSLDRYVPIKNKGVRFYKGRYINKSVDSSGYNQIAFTNEIYGRKAFSAHRLVALVFVDNPDKNTLVEVNHKNGIKTDNHYLNLEWVTSLDNKKHALKNGLIKRGSGLSYSKMVLDLQTGIFYESVTEAAIAKNYKNRTLHHWLFGDRTNKSSFILV